MKLVDIQYVEINLIAVAVLLTMLFYIKRMHQENNGDAQALFSQMLLCNVALLLSDIGIYLFNYRIGAVSFYLNHFMCVLYYLFHAVFGCIWFKYSLKRLYPEYRASRRQSVLTAIPCVLAGILTVLSPWTGWVYVLNEQNIYARGPALWAIILLSYLYWAVSAVIVAYEILKGRRNRERSLYWNLLLFPVPTVIGNLLQLCFYGLSITWICSAVSLLVLFVDLQNTQLSRDSLTGLFNRRQTNKQLLWEAENLRSGDRLYVVMVDVDHFKRFNDNFGHVAGDQALIAVADILQTCAAADVFIGRFGGDEFILIGHTKTPAAVDALLDRIHAKLSERNDPVSFPYTLSLSMGYALFGCGEELSLDYIISTADTEMYKDKALKNQTTLFQ